MGKPKHSNDPRGDQKGAQGHAEGQHGAVARAALKEQINNNGLSAAEQEEAQEAEYRLGKHRIYEGRSQHDVADQQAEKNRLQRDIDQLKLDREHFQVPGGRETHPALPPDDNEGTLRTPHDV